MQLLKRVMKNYSVTKNSQNLDENSEIIDFGIKIHGICKPLFGSIVTYAKISNEKSLRQQLSVFRDDIEQKNSELDRWKKRTCELQALTDELNENVSDFEQKMNRLKAEFERNGTVKSANTGNGRKRLKTQLSSIFVYENHKNNRRLQRSLNVVTMERDDLKRKVERLNGLNAI
ncbi:unnamed protein product [Caenorhabditis angaria]|uniref:Uncharacterized protein n=1 Tax=Caenorhabditis angaria TaxID=860376 RepID=A0A9P1I7T1_9PELO|nr:unnamed protein product [Caenorhabditis angaria]